MNRRTRWTLASAAVLSLSLAACNSDSDKPSTTSTPTGASAVATATPSTTATGTATPTSTAAAVSPTGYKDATYEVRGKPVTLKNGLSEVEATPGSASKITTRYLGNEATADFNGDGLMDIGFVLT